MDIHNKIIMSNFSRNIHKNHNINKRSSYQNIFETKNFISNFFNKYNLNYSKINSNSKIEPHTQKNINLYSINNSINHLFLNNSNKNLNYFDKRHIFSFKKKRIGSSYFDKVRNLYALKTPIFLSDKIANNHKKIITSQNINKKRNIHNNQKFYLPKVTNEKKYLINHFINKKLNKLVLENSKSSSVNGLKIDFTRNKIKLPRIKSTIIYNNKNLSRNILLNKYRRLKRCKSSTQVPNFGVKSIYMSLDVNNKKKNNKFNKGFLLKNNSNKSFNFITDKYINNENNPKKGQNNKNNNLIDNFNVLSKEKKAKREKGKEYDFSQSFKQINNLNLNLVNDNDMLLNDKGTLIGPFIK